MAAHIWLFRMSAEWFCRSDQLQSMANSNPALLWTPSECRLVELCYRCVFIWLKSAVSIFTSTCCRTPKKVSLIITAQNLVTIIKSQCLMQITFITACIVACDQKRGQEVSYVRSTAKCSTVIFVVMCSVAALQIMHFMHKESRIRNIFTGVSCCFIQVSLMLTQQKMTELSSNRKVRWRPVRPCELLNSNSDMDFYN